MKSWKNPKLGKEKWPGGLWEHEPDKIQWVDEETDYDCLIMRNLSGAWCGYVGLPDHHPLYGVEYSKCVRGRGCPEYKSYATQLSETIERLSSLPPGLERGVAEAWLPLLRRQMEGSGDASCNCDQTPGTILQAHGGITYSGEGYVDGEGVEYASRLCFEPTEGRPEKLWLFGFDCAHACDYVPGLGFTLGFTRSDTDTYRSREYVETEVRLLAKQLKELEQPAHPHLHPGVVDENLGADEEA